MTATRFRPKSTPKQEKQHMTRQESAALNIAKFIRARSLLLLERLELLDLDDADGDCEKMHERAEALFRKLDEHFSSQSE
jgi:hypothetical protein